MIREVYVCATAVQEFASVPSNEWRDILIASPRLEPEAELGSTVTFVTKVTIPHPPVRISPCRRLGTGCVGGVCPFSFLFCPRPNRLGTRLRELTLDLGRRRGGAGGFEIVLDVLAIFGDEVGGGLYVGVGLDNFLYRRV